MTEEFVDYDSDYETKADPNKQAVDVDPYSGMSLISGLDVQR